MQISDNIHLFLGKNQPLLESHSYLILGKKIILVDTGISADFLLSQIKSIGIKATDVDLIVNTHCHFDHIRNNKEIKNATKAKLAAFKTDAQYISSSDAHFTRAGLHGENLSAVPVDVQLKEGDKLEGFEILHTPGHTYGSICLFDKKRGILISGDTLFAGGSYGRTDLPTGSQTDMKKTLQKLSKLKIEKILPGHGLPVLQNAKESIESALEAD